MRRTAASLVPLLLGSLLPAAPLAAQVPVARVDSLFAAWDRPGSPGAAVAVLKDGEIVLERGYGEAQLEHGVPITPATVFHVASVTKQFTALAVALLAQRGALSLDDDVRAHLPELPDLGRPVTLRQLIHHTSGVRDQWELLAMAGWRLDDVITKDHILAVMRRQRELNFEPGSEHLYSNMGYTLLAEVVERVGGKPFPEWMAEHVFQPLGMTSTHMHDDHQHLVPGRAYSYAGSEEEGWRNAVLSYANAGATSLFTTAGDLARWLRGFETGVLGGEALVTQMRERGVLTSGDTLSYAFALVRGQHAGRTTWGHGGADAGFRSAVLHVPEERLGVVVLSNVASFNPSVLARAVADLYLGEDASAAEVAAPEAESAPARVTVPLRLLELYEGRYDVPQVGVLRVRREGARLLAEAGGPPVELAATSDSTFQLEGGPTLRFVRADGRVSGVVVSGPSGDWAGRRLEAPAPDPAALALLAGAYYSPELETVYHVAAEDDGLVATHARHGEIPLSPIDEDTFGGRPWYFRKLVFTRDAAGAVDGFLLSGGRVRDLRFLRLADGALPRLPPR